VAHVEDADPLSHCRVLRDDTASRYSIGMSQPPKSAIFAPSATWRSCSGESLGETVSDVVGTMALNLSRLDGTYHRRHNARMPARPCRVDLWDRAPVPDKESLVANLTISSRPADKAAGDAVVVGLVAGEDNASLAPSHGLPRKAVAHPRP
jgi:hypothetical protein